MDFNSLIESILLEGKMDDFKDSYANHPLLSRNIIDSYHDALPEGHKSVANLKWMLDRHIDHGLHPRDSKKVGKNIALFHHPDVKKHLAKKQLNQYATSAELEHAIAPHAEKLQEGKDKSEVVYHSPSLKVMHHPDHPSAVAGAKLPESNSEHGYLGGKASWCVSAASDGGEAHFKAYTGQGQHQMHTIEVTHPEGHTRKYAVIHGAGEYRDEHDAYFDPEKFVMKDHPEMLKTHLGRQMAGKAGEIVNEKGEFKPLHQVITQQNGPETERNPAAAHHPDWHNPKVLGDIASDPKKYGKSISHFAWDRLRGIGSDEALSAMHKPLAAMAKHPEDYHSLTIAQGVRNSAGEPLKTLVRNIPDSHHDNNPALGFALKNHSYTNASEIHDMMTDPKVAPRTKEALVQHVSVAPHTIRHIMNHPQDYNTNTKFAAGGHSNISREDIHAAVTNSHTDESFRNGAAYNSKMGEHTAEWIINNAHKESGGKEHHFMNLAAHKIRRETTMYESFEGMVVNGLFSK